MPLFLPAQAAHRSGTATPTPLDELTDRLARHTPSFSSERIFQGLQAAHHKASQGAAAAAAAIAGAVAAVPASAAAPSSVASSVPAVGPGGVQPDPRPNLLDVQSALPLEPGPFSLLPDAAAPAASRVLHDPLGLL